MNSADAWHPANAWPNDPNGSLVPVLEASIDAAKQRHPSASGDGPGVVLTAADRCDAGCGGGALYRVEKDNWIHPEGYAQPYINVSAFEFCHHHHHKFFPKLEEQGYRIAGQNPTLVAELYSSNRLKGEDHG